MVSIFACFVIVAHGIRDESEADTSRRITKLHSSYTPSEKWYTTAGERCDNDEHCDFAECPWSYCDAQTGRCVMTLDGDDRCSGQREAEWTYDFFLRKGYMCFAGMVQAPCPKNKGLDHTDELERVALTTAKLAQKKFRRFNREAVNCRARNLFLTVPALLLTVSASALETTWHPEWYGTARNLVITTGTGLATVLLSTNCIMANQVNEQQFSDAAKLMDSISLNLQDGARLDILTSEQISEHMTSMATAEKNLPPLSAMIQTAAVDSRQIKVGDDASPIGIAPNSSGTPWYEKAIEFQSSLEKARAGLNNSEHNILLANGHKVTNETYEFLRVYSSLRYDLANAEAKSLRDATSLDIGIRNAISERLFLQKFYLDCNRFLDISSVVATTAMTVLSSAWANTDDQFWGRLVTTLVGALSTSLQSIAMALESGPREQRYGEAVAHFRSLRAKAKTLKIRTEMEKISSLKCFNAIRFGDPTKKLSDVEEKVWACIESGKEGVRESSARMEEIARLFQELVQSTPLVPLWAIELAEKRRNGSAIGWMLPCLRHQITMR